MAVGTLGKEVPEKALRGKKWRSRERGRNSVGAMGKGKSKTQKRRREGG